MQIWDDKMIKQVKIFYKQLQYFYKFHFILPTDLLD